MNSTNVKTWEGIKHEPSDIMTENKLHDPSKSVIKFIFYYKLNQPSIPKEEKTPLLIENVNVKRPRM